MAGTYAATITYTAVGAEVVDPPTYPRVENGASFQDTTTNINRTCEALPIYDSTNPDPASTVIMTDSRNNQDYRVRRLQDGKCWMIDNLKLATPGAELILTPYDTNIPEGTNFTMPAIAITTVAERATNGICADEIISGTGNYLTCDGTADQSITNNTLIAYVDPSSTARCLNNTASNGDTVSYSTDSQTKCGYLYNWYTATAGTGTYGMISGDSATASICPVGWRLPNAGSGTAAMTNEFAVLNGAMAGNTNPTLTSDATTQPNWYSDGSFPATYAGYWADGFGQQGYGGLYWSVSAYSNTHAGPLNLYYSSVQPGNNKNTFKRSGLSIRCVLQLLIRCEDNENDYCKNATYSVKTPYIVSGVNTKCVQKMSN